MRSEESALQAECVRAFRDSSRGLREKGMLFSVHANTRHGFTTATAKQMAVEDGASDLVWMSPYGPIFIEILLPGKSQTKQQKDWADDAAMIGYTYLICQSKNQFRFIVLATLNSGMKLSADVYASGWLAHCKHYKINPVDGSDLSPH